MDARPPGKRIRSQSRKDQRVIEISEDSTEKVEKSQNPGVVYGLLEGYIGRRVRVKLLSEQDYSGLQIDTTSGELKSVTMVERFVASAGEDGEEPWAPEFDDLCIFAGQDEIEVDFDVEQLQVEVFQEDSRKWSLIYRSKHWKKMLKDGYLR